MRQTVSSLSFFLFFKPVLFFHLLLSSQRCQLGNSGPWWFRRSVRVLERAGFSRSPGFLACFFPRFRSRVVNSNKKFWSKVFVFNYWFFSSISLFASFDLFDSTLLIIISIKTFRDIFDELSIPCDTKSTSDFVFDTTFNLFHCFSPRSFLPDSFDSFEFRKNLRRWRILSTWRIVTRSRSILVNLRASNESFVAVTRTFYYR